MKAKHLLSALLIACTITISAQEAPKEKPQDASESTMQKRKHRQKGMTNALKDFTPEQIATIKSKKMALNLGLNDSQLKAVKKLELNNAVDRKAKMEAKQAKGDKPSSEEKFNMLNERLDQQLAYQREMEKILTDEQYEQWKKGVHKRSEKKKKFAGKRAQSRRG